MLADEEGPIDLWGLLTPQVLLIIVIAILVVLAVVGGLAILAWRRARRSGALDRGRRLLRRASLTVQAQAAPTQAAREVAGLRQQLAATVEQTHASVAAALEADSPVGELPSLVRRLTRAADALEAELGLLAREPDPAELNARLAAARARVGELGGAARRIRHAAAAARQGASDAGVAELTGDLDTELSALQAGVQALAQLDRPDRPGRQA
jgi:hypothetical protein